MDHDGPSDEEASIPPFRPPQDASEGLSSSSSSNLPSSQNPQDLSHPQNGSSNKSVKYESFPSRHRRMPSNQSSNEDDPNLPPGFKKASAINNMTTTTTADTAAAAATSKNAPKPPKSRGQVLVHYHPQLGDEGYESTLLGHGSDHYRNRRSSGGGTRAKSSPPTLLPYPARGGMHSRMIDDVRTEETMTTVPGENATNHSSLPNSNSTNGDNVTGPTSTNNADCGGNDQHNNAFTRQIRRRVFRATMVDQGKRKFLDAEEDIGGPPGSTSSGSVTHGRRGRSLNGRLGKEDGTTSVAAAPRATSVSPAEHFRGHTGGGDGSGSGKTDDRNDGRLKSPPSPPRHPPSYRLIVQSLIAENEPEKLSQIDRVMQKYRGREEELIKKLDLRYRKRNKIGSPGVGSAASVNGNMNVNVDSASGVGGGAGAAVAGNIDVADSRGGTERERGAATIGVNTSHVRKKEWNVSEKVIGQRNENNAANIERKRLDDDYYESEGTKEPKRTPSRNAVSAMHTNYRTHVDDFEEKPAITAATSRSLTRDFSESTKTAIASNMALMEESRVSSHMGIQAKSNTASVAAAAADNTKTTITGIINPIHTPKREGIKEKETLGTPSYDDGVSIITMETKETLTLKGQKGDNDFSFGAMLRRPPNSIIVDGSTNTDNNNSNVWAGNSDTDGSGMVRSPLTPHALTPAEELRQYKPPKIHRLLPGFEKETEERKTKALEESLEAAAKLDSVEARIRARNQLLLGRDVVGSDGSTGEASSQRVIEEKASVVGKTSRNLDPSLDEEEIMNAVESISDEKKRMETDMDYAEEDIATLQLEPVPETVPVTGDIDEQIDNNNDIPVSSSAAANMTVSKSESADFQMTKDMEAEIARLVAEREAEALRKAQEAIEKERKARIEAEVARIKAEQEVQRLKAKVESMDETDTSEPMEHQNVLDIQQKEVPAIDTKFSVAESSISSKRSTSPVIYNKSSRSNDEHANSSISDEEEAANLIHESDEDTVEKFRAVWSSDEDESQHHAANDEEDDDDTAHMSSDPEDLEDVNEGIKNSQLLVESQDLDQAESSSAHIDVTTLSEKTELAAEAEIPNDQAEITRTEKMESHHDFPSTTMQHAPLSAQYAEHVVELTEVAAPQQETEEEANIHHVAKVTFEGDPRKGQLSFITGAAVLAHSNQRGPWWLGRSGGRTGWFPASAVVPASEFLNNNCVDTPAIEEEEKEFVRMSQAELDKVYNLIRSPSDPIGSDDGSHDNEETDVMSPAKNRWMEDEIDVRGPISSRRGISPPANPRLDPSESVGLKERLFETKSSDDSQQKSAKENSTDKTAMTSDLQNAQKQIQNSISSKTTEASSQTLKPETTPTLDKPKRLWRTAIDKSTGLTYYYHIHTRETSWEKPPGFVARQTPTKGSTADNDATTPRSKERVESSASKDITRSVGDTTPASAIVNDPKTTKKHHGGKGILKFLRKRKSKADKDDKPPKKEKARGVTAKGKGNGEISSSEAVDPVAKLADLKQDPANQAHFSYDDEDDDSYSSSSDKSDQTDSSIFSTRRLREAVGKMTDKMTGLSFRNIQNNSSYETLDDEKSKKLKHQSSESPQPENTSPHVKPTKSTKSEAAAVEEKNIPSNRNVAKNHTAGRAKPAGNDSGWRSAIDPITQNTYYYNKITKEVVWDKPSNF
ncbi:hypothetical protein ACHAXS_008451 [Conticribra weissflogii]